MSLSKESSLRVDLDIHDPTKAGDTGSDGSPGGVGTKKDQ
jgi:hypothetical protein